MAEKIRHFTAGIFFFTALFFLFVVIWARPNLFVEPRYRIVQIPKGSSARALAHQLKTEGVIHSPSFFLTLCYLEGKAQELKPGAYRLPRGRYGDILDKIAEGQTYKVKLTFPEGWSAFQIGELLLKRHIISSIEDFMRQVRSQHAQGKLFPETYFLDLNMTSSAVIHAMTAQFNRVWTDTMTHQAAAMHMTQKQVLTLASIVERETHLKSERPKVAQVYLLRRRMGMGLDADPTVQYAVGEGRYWPKALRYKDLRINSPYNTYRHRGLPPTPICNPGLASIQAVLHPARTHYLYFIADGTGGHHFSQTFSEHEAFRNALKRLKK